MKVFVLFASGEQEERVRQGLPIGFENSKQKRLEDLFRPPIDLIFSGNFQAARDTGTKNNRWILVNIQNNQEFKCQVLNRDVWSDQRIKTLIKENFVFWQVSESFLLLWYLL
jgi:thioredoxin-related protein